MTPSLPAQASSLQDSMEKAKADLAQRMSVPVNDIVLLQAESVTWPDSSLGCPQEGMAYAQVLTPGYLILLKADGKLYEYHANDATRVIFCANPKPPVPGMPGNV